MANIRKKYSLNVIYHELFKDYYSNFLVVGFKSSESDVFLKLFTYSDNFNSFFSSAAILAIGLCPLLIRRFSLVLGKRYCWCLYEYTFHFVVYPKVKCLHLLGSR